MRKFLLTLIVLIAIVIGVGFYLGWFVASMDRNADSNGKITVSLDINPAKIFGTTQAVAQKAEQVERGIKEKIDGQGNAETVKGTIAKVEPAAKRLVVTSGDKEVTIVVEPTSKVRLNDADIKLDDLRVGDHINAVYDVKDGQNIARSVTVAART
jgi:Cu/Ag efflux protein CusF